MMTRSPTGRVGLAVAVVGVAALVAWPMVRHRQAQRARTKAGAARAFLAAEQRSLFGTWLVEQRFTRLVSAKPGQPFVETIRDAQRPPDHLITAPGTIDSVFHGRRMACAVGPDGGVHCRDAGVLQSYDDLAQQQLRTLAAYVQGANAPYAVADQGGGCFVLRLRPGRLPGRVFGTRSQFCFDRATDAPVRTEVDRAEGQDVTVATSLSETVTDDDLKPPA